MNILELLFYYFIIFLPFFILIYLIKIVKNEYFRITQKENDLSIERVMYEIKIPKEVLKTPLAMEIVFSSLYSGGGESVARDVLFKGARRNYLSLELVSDGGEVRFYIWCPKKMIKVVEAAFYGQYPGVQLIEVQDYTKFTSLNSKEDNLFGIEYALAKDDPYPIKTYKKFGLDKVGLKPEETSNPMSHIIEVLSNIPTGHKVWIQIVLKAQKNDKLKKLSIFNVFKEKKFSEKKNWSSEADDIIEKIRTVDSKQEENKARLTASRESDLINDIIENTKKPSFWTGIRALYFSKKDIFDPLHIAPIATIFSSLSSSEFNQLVPRRTSGDETKYLRKPKYKKESFFNDFKRRRFFLGLANDPYYYTPFFNFGYKEHADDGYVYKDFILSTEELATIFHLPSTTISSPNFQREESTKGQAPSNLPI